MSEDDSIERFDPQPSTNESVAGDAVWAVDTRHLPMFWFPRECPRATFWADERTTPDDAERFLHGTSQRVHAIEGAWLDRCRMARVVAYRLPEAPFTPHEVGGYWIAREPVTPLEMIELGDLITRHADAAIELRIVPNLWPLWDRVIASTLQFSGMRLRNAEPRPAL